MSEPDQRPQRRLSVLALRADRVALVAGSAEELDRLGETLVRLPPATGRLLGRAVGTVAQVGAGAPTAVGSRWVRLTVQTHMQVQQSLRAASGEGARSAVTVAQGVRLDLSGLTRPLVLDSVARGLADEYRVGRLERALGEVDAQVTRLRDDRLDEADAALGAALQTLDRVQDRVLRRGHMADEDFAALQSVEAEVHTHGERAARRLRVLDEAAGLLAAGTAAVEVRQTLAGGGTGFWLRHQLRAAQALARWDALYLLHETEASPDSVEQLARTLGDRSDARDAELRRTAALLGRLVDAAAASGALVDRMPGRRRAHQALRTELDALRRGYHRALALEDPDRGADELTSPAEPASQDPAWRQTAEVVAGALAAGLVSAAVRAVVVTGARAARRALRPSAQHAPGDQ